MAGPARLSGGCTLRRADVCAKPLPGNGSGRGVLSVTKPGGLSACSGMAAVFGAGASPQKQESSTLAHLLRIFPGHDLVYIRYSGMATLDDYIAVVEEYPRHPDFRLGQKHLIDLSHLGGIERDYTRIMALQAKIAEFASRTPSEIMSVVVAPTPVALEATQIVFRSWQDLDTPVVRRVVPSMAEACGLLGIGEEELAGLLASV